MRERWTKRKRERERERDGLRRQGEGSGCVESFVARRVSEYSLQSDLPGEVI